MMSKEHGHARHDDAGGAEAADPGRSSPEAEGVDPSVNLLGPEEIRAVFAKAAERDDLQAKFLRAQADLENFRRRESAERRRAAEDEADRALAPMLDAIDSFRRAADAAEKAKDFGALLDGVNLVLRELERRLGELGVSMVEGTGQPMDPGFQQAILAEPTADFPPLTVLQVFAHGWKRGGRVIRPAQVKVAAPPPPPAAEAETETE
jgi:molecular chaperone GrpE